MVLTENLCCNNSRRLTIQPKSDVQKFKKFYSLNKALKAREELNLINEKVQRQIKLRLIELENAERVESQERYEKLKQAKERKELDTLINLPCRSRSKLFKIIDNPNIPLDFQRKIDEFCRFNKAFNDSQLIRIENFVKVMKTKIVNECVELNDSISLDKLLFIVMKVLSLDLKFNFENYYCFSSNKATKLKMLNEFLKKLEYCKQISNILKKTKNHLEEFNIRFLFIGDQLENWYNYRDKILKNQETICVKLTSLVLMWFANYRINNQKRLNDVSKIKKILKESKNDKNFTQPSTIRIIYSNIVEKKCLNLSENYVMCLQHKSCRYKENKITNRIDDDSYKSELLNCDSKLETIEESDEKEN